MFNKLEKVDLIKHNKVIFLASILSVIACFGLFFTKGFNKSIDFTGGLVIEVLSNATENDLVKITTETISRTSKHKFTTQISKSLDNSEYANGIVIRFQGADSINMDEMSSIKSELKFAISDAQIVRSEFISPVFSNELIKKASLAVLFGIVAIGIYIWFRFEWQYSLGAVTALFHDTVLTLGFISLCGIEFDSSIIAALLTVIGYSVNDSVIIYDRIRLTFKQNQTASVYNIVKEGVSKTLSRTTITSSTTLISSLVIAVFGGDVLRGFGLTLLFGIAIGTYSSIFISASTLLYAQPKRTKEEGKVVF